mgnify:CR=1 FL=1
MHYRPKEKQLKPTHYICSTGLAIAHVQNVCIHRFRHILAEDGKKDERIEAFGTMEARFFELIGLASTTAQREAWLELVSIRAQRSLYRRTVEC